MSDEGNNDDVEKIIPDPEGKIKPTEDGKYPEVVPWSKYVRIKEMLTKKEEQFAKTENELKDKVTSLEEKLSKAGNPDEFQKVKGELEDVKSKLTQTEEELKTTKEKSLTEKRELLQKRGIPEDKVKAMSERELDAALVTLEYSKPKSDMGSGSGSNVPQGKPMDLARMAYESSNK